MSKLPFSVGFALFGSAKSKAVNLSDLLASPIASGCTVSKQPVAKNGFMIESAQFTDMDSAQAALYEAAQSFHQCDSVLSPVGPFVTTIGTNNPESVSRIVRRHFNWQDTFSHFDGLPDGFGEVSKVGATSALWESLEKLTSLPAIVAAMNPDPDAVYSVDIRTLATDGVITIQNGRSSTDTDYLRDWFAFNVEFCMGAVTASKLYRRHRTIGDAETPRDRMVKLVRGTKNRLSAELGKAMLARFDAIARA